MISIISVLLTVVSCFYIGILYTNPVILTIGYTLGIILVLSIAEVVYRVLTYKYYIDVPIAMSESGRPVQVVIKIQNKGFLPAGKVEVEIESKNVFHNSEKKQRLYIQDISVGMNQHVVQMLLNGAGCHDILLKHVKVYSLFGLICMKRKCKDFCSVLIMPNIYSTNVQLTEPVRNFLGDADVYDDFRSGHDSAETFEIREYREKDKLQSIHWKLSAKMDTLMVKESSLPKACAIVLMLELKPKQNKKKRKKEKDTGAYLELAASISFSLMDQKCPHFVAWYSAKTQEMRRVRVDNEESFYLFLDAYLRETVAKQIDIRKEYRKKYKSEWYLHDILINEKLEVYKDDKFIIKLDEKKIKDECEKLEVLL